MQFLHLRSDHPQRFPRLCLPRHAVGHRAAGHRGRAAGALRVAAAGDAGRAGAGSHGTGAARGAGFQDDQRSPGGMINPIPLVWNTPGKHGLPGKFHTIGIM